MKLINALFVFSLFAVVSCGGGKEGEESSEAGESKIDVTVTSESDALKGFEKKDAIAFYSGMNFGGKSFNKVLYIVVANHEGLELNSFSVEPPPANGVQISVAIYGPKGEDKENLTAIPIGVIDAQRAENGQQFTVGVAKAVDGKSWPESETLGGERMIMSSKIKGTVEIKEITDKRVKGTLSYSEEGGGELTIEFDTAIADDLWAKML